MAVVQTGRKFVPLMKSRKFLFVYPITSKTAMKDYRHNIRCSLGRLYCSSATEAKKLKRILPDGPSFETFLTEFEPKKLQIDDFENSEELKEDCSNVPYISKKDYFGYGRRVFIETYGCQMNHNDTDIALSILGQNGFNVAADLENSDVILVMTCAIREGAEQKIWKRLEYLKFLKKHRLVKKPSLPPLTIGLLGCMAERLKTKILERDQLVDLICGPDAYRDLPRLLSLTSSGQAAVNVLLSLDETYSDVLPVRRNINSPSAFVSIMRGCDNMCSYCIVPFTRGRERSRPIESILNEIKQLSDQGVKEVTLLGQNVNSYQDLSLTGSNSDIVALSSTSREGFKTVYKPKVGGLRFANLLDRASRINPEMRIRFTSPHPKDFSDDVLYLIRDRPNICNNLHLPAQSGSNSVLESMQRGYTVEAYVDLVDHIRRIIPDVTLSSDFIAGFCGETEQDHQQTLDLMRRVKYNFAYCFPYSMRKKTQAFHRLKDDVPDDVKARRHAELTSVFRQEVEIINRSQHGQQHLVLIEGIEDSSSQVLKGTGLHHTTLEEFYSTGSRRVLSSSS